MLSLTAFLDASVVLSGLASERGGSNKLLTGAQKHKLRLVVTPLIINEVRRHLDKLNIPVCQLEMLLDQKVLLLVDNPSKKIIRRCCSLTSDPNDAHVLAGAIVSGANICFPLIKTILSPRWCRNIFCPSLSALPNPFGNRWYETRSTVEKPVIGG
jgi:predicted nucleic acid-binding protein